MEKHQLELTADQMTIILTTLKDGVELRGCYAEKPVMLPGVAGDMQHADRQEALQRAIEARNIFTQARGDAMSKRRNLERGL